MWVEQLACQSPQMSISELVTFPNQLKVKPGQSRRSQGRHAHVGDVSRTQLFNKNRRAPAGQKLPKHIVIMTLQVLMLRLVRDDRALSEGRS